MLLLNFWLTWTVSSALCLGDSLTTFCILLMAFQSTCQISSNSPTFCYSYQTPICHRTSSFFFSLTTITFDSDIMNGGKLHTHWKQITGISSLRLHKAWSDYCPFPIIPITADDRKWAGCEINFSQLKTEVTTNESEKHCGVKLPSLEIN